MTTFATAWQALASFAEACCLHCHMLAIPVVVESQMFHYCRVTGGLPEAPVRQVAEATHRLSRHSG